MTDHDLDREQRTVYATVVLACAPVLIGVGVARAAFDGLSTLALLVFLAALVALLRS
jgi:1,4-dihydroxy-2-naphthoate octaprenyltransferase